MKRLSKDETPKNLMSASFDTQDGHGGKSEKHRKEMEEIARKVYAEEMAQIENRMYEIAYQAYSQAIRDFMKALEYDVESITKIGFDGCRDIFEDRKTQKYISDHIMKEIEKQLNNKHFRK